MDQIQRIHQQVKGAQISASGVSDTGRVRTENQDAIYLDREGHCLLLADGMGGHEHGAEASQTIIEILPEFFQPERIEAELKDITNVEGAPAEIICLYSLVDKAISKANALLYERNKKARLERYMGSTVVGLVPVKSGHVLWFHVGDSRLYLWRDNTLKVLTHDHSAYTDWLRTGRTGKEPTKNIVTKAIGPKEGVVPDIDWAAYQKHDIYILCSDGMNDMLPDPQIADIIKGSEDVDDMTVKLVEAALDAGGTDNTSVIGCQV
jgi:serine/threonine protein phosphatase PrpC